MCEKLQCLYCMQEFDGDQVEFFYSSERGHTDTLFQTFGSRFLDYNMPPRKGFFYRKGQQDVEVIEEEQGVPMKVRVKLQDQDMASAASSAVRLFEDEDEQDTGAPAASGKDSGEYVGEHDEVRDIVTKVCPHCHSRLPIRDMIKSKTHHVFLLGGTGAGKTTYLVAMLQQLEQMLSKGLHLASVSFGAESEPYYHTLREQYSTKGVLDATQLKTQLGGGIFPIVMDIESSSAANQRAFVVLHDFPGEGMKEEEYLANLRELEKAETVIVIGDVNQFYNIDRERTKDIRYFEGDFDGMFRSIRGSAIPAMTASTVLCVLLKIDLIMSREGEQVRAGYIAPKQALQSGDMGMHVGAVDMDTIDRASRTIDENIRQVTSKSLTNHLRTVFDAQKQKPQCYKCFGVSTFTKTESGWSNIYDVSGTKHRVIEPMLFLLAHWGLVAQHASAQSEEPVKRSWLSRFFGRRDEQ